MRILPSTPIAKSDAPAMKNGTGLIPPVSGRMIIMGVSVGVGVLRLGFLVAVGEGSIVGEGVNVEEGVSVG